MSTGIDIIFLGTGGSLPTKNRALPSTVLRRDGELLIFDCGEGTQRQMMHAKIGFNKVTALIISHLHPDHTLGLPGLLLTMSSLGRDKPLTIFGPSGLARLVGSMQRLLGFTTTFPVTVTELQPGDQVDRGDYVLKTALAKHDIPCLAYSVEEKARPGRFHPERAKKLQVQEGPQWGELQRGKPVTIQGRVIQPKQVMDPPRPGLKFVYAIDTRPSESVKTLAKNADLLAHDGGFTEERKPKAVEYFHSTAKEAAILARAAKSKRLALIHISAVTRDSSVLLKEARRQFKRTIVPEDLSILMLKRTK